MLPVFRVSYIPRVEREADRVEVEEEQVSVVQFDKAGVAVVEEVVYDGFWRAPRFTIVVRAYQLHLAVRAHVGIAVAGEDGKQFAVAAAADGWPAYLPVRFTAYLAHPFYFRAGLVRGRCNFRFHPGVEDRVEKIVALIQIALWRHSHAFLRRQRLHAFVRTFGSLGRRVGRNTCQDRLDTCVGKTCRNRDIAPAGVACRAYGICIHPGIGNERVHQARDYRPALVCALALDRRCNANVATCRQVGHHGYAREFRIRRTVKRRKAEHRVARGGIDRQDYRRASGLYGHLLRLWKSHYGLHGCDRRIRKSEIFHLEIPHEKDPFRAG